MGDIFAAGDLRSADVPIKRYLCQCMRLFCVLVRGKSPVGVPETMPGISRRHNGAIMLIIET
jgi:hypothetical protein